MKRRPNTKFALTYLRCNDESSECATARQHKVAAVAAAACYRLEKTLMGCIEKGGSVHPISVLEFTKTELDGGSS